MGYQMRVIVSGSEFSQINKIAVTTFLNGLYCEYKDNLFIIFSGKGHISNIVEEWIGKTWPGSASRNCFDLSWLIEHWSGEEELEGIGRIIVQESKPDLAFLFGYDQYKLVRYLRYADIPTFYVEKNE